MAPGGWFRLGSYAQSAQVTIEAVSATIDQSARRSRSFSFNGKPPIAVPVSDND